MKSYEVRAVLNSRYEITFLSGSLEDLFDLPSMIIMDCKIQEVLDAMNTASIKVNEVNFDFIELNSETKSEEYVGRAHYFEFLKDINKKTVFHKSHWVEDWVGTFAGIFSR